jgi:hypothetical protein
MSAITALEQLDAALLANRDHQQAILDFASECQAREKAVESLLVRHTIQSSVVSSP